MKETRNHTLHDNDTMKANAERWRTLANITDDKAMKAKLELFAKLTEMIAD